MVSGWTLPGLLSAESNCCNKEVQMEIRAVQSLLLRPTLGFWLEIGCPPMSSHCHES